MKGCGFEPHEKLGYFFGKNVFDFEIQESFFVHYTLYINFLAVNNLTVFVFVFVTTVILTQCVLIFLFPITFYMTHAKLSIFPNNAKKIEHWISSN